MYKSRSNNRQTSLFWDLETMLDPKHPLFKLANMVNWSCFEEAFAPLFCADNGRPPKPIRLMVGLLMLILTVIALCAADGNGFYFITVGSAISNME